MASESIEILDQIDVASIKSEPCDTGYELKAKEVEPVAVQNKRRRTMATEFFASLDELESENSKLKDEIAKLRTWDEFRLKHRLIKYPRRIPQLWLASLTVYYMI